MANDFKPTVGGKVLKADAEKWIAKYDKDRLKDKDDTKSVFYGKDFINSIFAEHPNAAGISFFLADKPNGNGKDTVQLVLVPTTEDGQLLWNLQDGKDGGGTAYDSGTICPPFCPKP
ncbi:MAG: hypothetical protein ACOYXA_00410 [Bacteroidota bacterium]